MSKRDRRARETKKREKESVSVGDKQTETIMMSTNVDTNIHAQTNKPTYM